MIDHDSEDLHAFAPRIDHNRFLRTIRADQTNRVAGHQSERLKQSWIAAEAGIPQWKLSKIVTRTQPPTVLEYAAITRVIRRDSAISWPMTSSVSDKEAGWKPA